MTKLLSKIALAGALTIAPMAAHAQLQAVAVVDLDKAVGESAALVSANAQIQTQYKAQIDAFQARRQAAATEMQGLQTELQTLQRTNAPQATIQQKVAAAQAREQALQTQLQPLAAPFQRPAAYASAQVQEKLDAAVRAAMTAKRVGVLLKPEATLALLPANDITPDVTAQLNLTVKTVSITPPANWQPGQPTSATAPTGR